MEQVNTKDIARKMAEHYNVKYDDALTGIRRVLAAISRELLEGNKVVLHHFGRFETRTKAEHAVTTFGKRYIVPEHSYIHFKPYSDLIFYGNIFYK